MNQEELNSPIGKAYKPKPETLPKVIGPKDGASPRPGVKRAGKRKINIEFIEDKSRRHITFSKRKAGIMKKAYELSTLTGTQVLLLVASETGHVYTFATPKLQPLITKPEGKNLIQACLNAPETMQQQPPTQSSPTYAQDHPSNVHQMYHADPGALSQSVNHEYSHGVEDEKPPGLGTYMHRPNLTMPDVKPFANQPLSEHMDPMGYSGYNPPASLVNPVRMAPYVTHSPMPALGRPPAFAPSSFGPYPGGNPVQGYPHLNPYQTQGYPGPLFKSGPVGAHGSPMSHPGAGPA